MKVRLCFRSVLIAVMLFGCFLVLCTLSLISLVIMKFSRTNFISYTKIWITHQTFRLISQIAGLVVTAEGLDELPKDPFILLANHVSYWDVIAISGLLPICFIAKEEVRSWPFFGFFAKLCDVIFVRRQSGFSRAQALFTLASRSRRLPYCIFPEGTTTAADLPLWENWFQGNISLAVRPGLPIYTLGIHYRNQSEQAWIGDASFFPHLLSSLSRPRTEIFMVASRLPLSAADCRVGSLQELAYRGFLQVRSGCELAKSLAVRSKEITKERFQESQSGADFKGSISTDKTAQVGTHSCRNV